MFRFNLVCSPEMSVCDQEDVESLPHAFVQFDADEVKAYVPLNFIMRYPTEWRTKSAWDNTYLYKVFWSQDPDDSPTEMAKRVAKIPVYEKGSSLEKPGYYRASVLAVDESLQAVESKVEGKRISVGLLKFKHTSFDAATSSVKVKTDKSEPSKKRGSGKAKSKVNKGLKKESHVKNLLDVDSTLTSKYEFLNEYKTDASKDLSVTPRRSARSSSSVQKRKRESSSESSDSREIIDPKDPSKAIKLDPTYTPKKTNELQESLESTEKLLQNSYARNKKLEQDKKALENQVNELNDTKDKLQGKIETLQKFIGTQADDIKELQEQLTSFQKKNEEYAKSCQCQINNSVPDFEDVNGTSDSGDDFKGQPETNANLARLCETNYEKVKTEPSAELLQKNESHVGNVCEGKDEDKASDPAQKVIKQEVDNSCKLKEEPFSNGGECNEDHELCPGVKISSHIWKAITSLSTGVSKDIIFIKDLAMAAFGPEVLGASTIYGTKKGGSRSKKEGETPKPGLDKRILKAVREEFVKRVAKDEKCTITQAEGHERNTDKKFNRALQDGIKRVVGLGYGKGTLSNTITQTLLMK